MSCGIAEALPADLKAHQRQLMATARDVLVGCEDEVWPAAAPTACAVVCALGDTSASYLPGNVGREMLCVFGLS